MSFARLGASAVALCAATASGQIQFENVTDAAGLNYPVLAQWHCSAAVGDYDGDGWLDVVLVGSDGYDVRIFHNNGDKTFTDMTSSVLPEGTPQASMAIFADLDNDGDLDLNLVDRHGGTYLDTSYCNLRNDGGSYTLMEHSGTLARHNSRIGGMALADVDNDGLLDVVATHYFGPGYSMHNEGGFVFVDSTSRFGANLNMDTRHWGCVFGDFNNDGFVDLHHAIDFFLDYQARSNGDGTFTDVSRLVHVDNLGADMGVTIGDIDNDGDFDIFSSNIGVHCLYVNDGTGNFSDQANARGVRTTGNGVGSIGWGVSFSDFDLDRDVDLAMVGDMGLFENDGTGHFTRAFAGSGLTLGGGSLVSFDYDNDGDLDVLVFNNRAELFENVTPRNGNHWLGVQLHGTTSNSYGVGARVEVNARGTQMMREIQCGTSYMSAGPMIAHFGLGDSNQAFKVKVRWPSGKKSFLRNVPADQYITIREPD